MFCGLRWPEGCVHQKRGRLADTPVHLAWPVDHGAQHAPYLARRDQYPHVLRFARLAHIADGIGFDLAPLTVGNLSHQ